MGMTLYEMTQAALELQELLESGEIDETVFADTLDGLGVQDKVENICKVVRNLEATAASCKAEKQRLEQKQKAAENGVKRLKESLMEYMQTVNAKKVTAGLFTVSVRSSESVLVLDESKIPDEYRVHLPDKINVAKIRKALRDGEEVPYAVIEPSSYVTIR